MKNPAARDCFMTFDLAEREGFEPPDLLQSTVFKTAAIDHSAISPRQKYYFFPLILQSHENSLKIYSNPLFSNTEDSLFFPDF
jgi:hypothetical protein